MKKYYLKINVEKDKIPVPKWNKGSDFCGTISFVNDY